MSHNNNNDDAVYDYNAAIREARTELSQRRQQIFDELCATLLRNDPNLHHVNLMSTKKEDVQHPIIYGYRLGQALQSNSHVTMLSLDLSLAAVEIRNQNNSNNNDVDLLLQFVQTSSILRTLNLGDGCINERDGMSFFFSDSDDDDNNHSRNREGYTPHIARFLCAMANNPSIKEVTFVHTSNMRIPIDALRHFLQTTVSLERLEINLHSIAGGDVESVALAFGANTTLQSLKLLQIDDPTQLSHVLDQLKDQVSLRSLSVQRGDNEASISQVAEQIDHLSDYIRSTNPLQNLEVRQYIFDEASMTTFVDALQSNSSVHHLGLSSCYLRNDATQQMLSAFVQQIGTTTQTTATANAMNGRSQCGIRSITFDHTLLWYHHRSTTAAAKLAAEMLLGSKISSIQLLEGGSTMNFATEFCTFLQSHATQISISSLQLGHINTLEWKSVAECLPNLLHLREFTVPEFRSFIGPEGHGSVVSFVQAFRCNGSIHQLQTVALTERLNDRNELRSLRDTELRLVEAYCHRNHFMSEVLPRSLLVRESNENDSTTAHEDDGRTVDISLFPTLLSCARQVPLFGPRSILVGLLTAVDYVGPSSHLVGRTNKRGVSPQSGRRWKQTK